ncbi:RUN [Mactra antiquata]
MNYVYGRSMVVMDSSNDRMRLKDKIVANVAKAVKSIQELQILSGTKTVTLGNYDWQCHRLCEHLDHTLLHGLRHVTPGYWKIVSEFTHKDCIKEIKRMSNVTTDLGRGRAWLYMALNECLLESYLRCYQQNDNLVEEFYVRDALVRDQDKFNILLTIISGLECTEFQLECDMPYLDLCVYPPKSKQLTNRESTIDFDSLSVCSMESVYVPSKPLPQAVFEANDIIKPEDDDTYSTRPSSTGPSYHGDPTRHSPSLDSGIHSDWNYRQRSITPIDRMSQSSTSQELDSQGADLEVVHLGKKGKPHRHKKKKKKFVSVASISEPEAFADDYMINTNGPVIEIPPLDDIKLFSAILNNQNNNDPEFDSGSGDVSDKGNGLVISRTRSPGDGMEIPEDRLDGNVPNVDDKNISVVNDSNDKKQEVNANPSEDRLDSLYDSENENIDKNMVNSSVNDKIEAITGTGTFTDLIRARVSNIVSAGELLESKEIENEFSEQNVEDTNNTSIYDNPYGAELSEKHLESILNEEPVSEDNGKSHDEANLVKRSTSQVPSIYNTNDTYSSSDDEDTEFLKQEIKLGRSNSVRSSPSIQSNSSTRSSFSKLPDVVDNFDKESVSSGKNRKPVSPHLYSSHSSRTTPDFISSNQNRSKSVMSYSSANETEDELSSANQKSGHSRRGSRMSANEGTIYRNSPALSTDTHSSAQSPSTDLETSGKVLEAKVEELIVQKKLNQYTHLTFGEDDDNNDDDDAGDDLNTLSTRDRSSSLCPGEVVFDNNTMLYLMLDILKEDDSIVKMFSCQQGHTDGKTKTILLLISVASIYLLQPEKGRKKFQTLAVIPFDDIDFITIGFNNQVLQIACKSKRQKYWITTGEETITISIVDCLADSMEKCESKPGQLEVDTSNTLQKISLQKYIRAECRCETEEAEVICYSLVYWEDPGTDKGSCEWDRDGSLYYKSNETTNILGTQTWRLAHATLRDSMLCLYHDKQDNKPVHFLSVGAGQCVGCKRDFNSDKNHVIQIMLSDGSYWSIALESEDEANKWLQGLCQAVAEGLKMKPTRPSCVPCCMILSQHKLLMCHEDLETNFIRTLGSANLHDVTSVYSDEFNKSYLVLVFESEDDNVSNEKWVLYFNSDHECSRFQTSLSHCWYKHFQVEVPVLPMDDFTLQKICTEMVQHLKSIQTI